MHKYSLIAAALVMSMASVGAADARRAPVAGAGGSPTLAHALNQITNPDGFGDVYCRKMLAKCDAGDEVACRLFERYCSPAD